MVSEEWGLIGNKNLEKVYKVKYLPKTEFIFLSLRKLKTRTSCWLSSMWSLFSTKCCIFTCEIRSPFPGNSWTYEMWSSFSANSWTSELWSLFSGHSCIYEMWWPFSCIPYFTFTSILWSLISCITCLIFTCQTFPWLSGVLLCILTCHINLSWFTVSETVQSNDASFCYFTFTFFFYRKKT